jgi:adenine-specific DNA methylase
VNFIKFESAQKLRGGFYTAPDIATFLTRWVAQARPQRILEPSCGDGAFLRAIQKQAMPRLKKIFACEMDSIEAGTARSQSKRDVTEIHAGDFLRWYLFQSARIEAFDAVLGNPPFIRYQYLPDEQQILAEKILGRFNLPFTKHTNAWVPFVIASFALLRAGGRLAMVIPSEIFHIPHAQALRQFLTEKCSRILLLDPDEIWFDGTLQGTVLLMAERKQGLTEKCQGVAVVNVANRRILEGDPEKIFQTASYTKGETITGKWMGVFLNAEERSLLKNLRENKKVKTFDQIASVDVGIVTGANKFFLVPDKTVEQFGLKRWAHPMFGRSDHVEGLIFSDRDHVKNKQAGIPSNFLWFQEEEIESLPPKVRQYLEMGTRDLLHLRYKCRVRRPWFKVPSVYTSPVAMLKRAHHFPRLILNHLEAYTTDTAYRITLKAVRAESLVFGFVNSMTCLTAEMEGRHYGGGVLELVPSEIERLLLPVVDADRRKLRAADQRFRTSGSDLSFLQEQDAIILPKIGLSEKERKTLFGAWLKLRNRRQRAKSVLDTCEDPI